MVRLHACQAFASGKQLQASTNLVWRLKGVYTLGNASVCKIDPSMADTELVTAIAFGLSYFYLKCKQSETKKRKTRRQRRWWMKKIHRNRTRQFIEEKFNELLYEPSGEFDNFCRMSYTDFEFLLQKISPMISKQDTDFRDAIPAKFRLAITLRFLASGDSYKSLHYMFKVSVSMISITIREVCRSLNEILKDLVKMPTTAEGWLNIEEGFRTKFPHCIGSLDGKHVVIESPTHSGTEYFNYKKTFSIVLLALVDSKYKFVFADIGSQGRISDGGVFNNCLLWKRICRNEIDFPPPCPLPGSNINIPYVFLADGAFALSQHVMKPYPGNHEVGSPKRLFNQNLSKSRVVVENTFGILTSVFRIFRRPIDLEPQTVTEFTMTCVLLHNFLRTSKSSSNRYIPQGSLDVYDSSGNMVTPGSWRRDNDGYNALQTLPQIPRRSPLNAKEVREEFTSYFNRIG
ncbi:uncharacterized protein LOC114352172 [Ostrinia furnacalis]|uniref:uncharacterized protein LOC114352172 n=3 Tax=Ostrinia TaxID=29056 RepID=UPI00103FF424|nr:uncharacterized protein LOC114352172 [Ostrinia furnacalis]